MSIVAKGIQKSLGEPANQVLKGISLSIEEGEFVALTGRSGSGKSTLLYTLSSLDTPTEGVVQIDGQSVRQLNVSELADVRNRKIGFVFQFHYLIAELTALENVILPAKRAGEERQRLDLAKNLLKKVGLEEKMHRLPRQMSGGEQQRVAIARSLIMEPKYLFADEPTGSLDSVNGEAVMKIFEEVNQQKNTTIILVTHDPSFAARAKRQIHLVDGQIVLE